MKSKYIKGITMENKLSAARKVVSAVALFVLVVAVGVFVVYNPAFNRSNVFVILTFFINIALFVSQLLLSSTEHAFGFKVMFWTFNLFFFGLAPFYQYVSGSAIWGYKPTDREFLINNILVLAWSAMYIIGGTIQFGKKKRALTPFTKEIDKTKYKFVIRKNVLNAMLLISLLIVVYYLVFVGCENMFYRETSSNPELNGSTMLVLLEEHILKNIVVFTFVIHVVEAKEKKFISAQLVLSTICLLINNFPTGLSRFAMAAVYAGIMIIVIDKTRKGRWFVTVFILALVVVFPALDIFRNVDTFEAATNFWNSVKKEIESIYTTGDYDSYAMFINVRRYVNFFDYSYGYQLLGALFFFFPRSIWSTKPMGTWYTAFLALHPEFTNVSAPLIAEGYIDFGVLGVVIYALVIGALTAWADKKYWSSNDPLSKERIVYPFLMMQFFFLLRGDLMSGIAFFAGKYATGTLVYWMVIKKVLVNNENETPEKPRLSKYIKVKNLKDK